MFFPSTDLPVDPQFNAGIVFPNSPSAPQILFPQLRGRITAFVSVQFLQADGIVTIYLGGTGGSGIAYAIRGHPIPFFGGVGSTVMFKRSDYLSIIESEIWYSVSGSSIVAVMTADIYCICD